jgi:hypothetical protein
LGYPLLKDDHNVLDFAVLWKQDSAPQVPPETPGE